MLSKERDPCVSKNVTKGRIRSLEILSYFSKVGIKQGAKRGIFPQRLSHLVLTLTLLTWEMVSMYENIKVYINFS